MPADIWDERQRELMDRSYGDTERISQSDDPLDRVLLLSAEKALYGSHLLNLVSTYSADASFRLLDVGCGDGRVAHEMAQRFPNAQVVGIDAHPRSIELARSLPPLPNLVFAAEKIEDMAVSESFDFVICSEVYEHVSDPAALLHTIRGLLRPGGFLSLSTPSGWMARVPRLTLIRERLFDRERYRLRRFPERAWPDALELHPGTRMRVLKERLADADFAILYRDASSPWVNPGSRSIVYYVQRAVGVHQPQRSLLYTVCRVLARGDKRQAARRLYHFYLVMEGLMNLLSPLRLLESRTVVLAQGLDHVTPPRSDR